MTKTVKPEAEVAVETNNKLQKNEVAVVDATVTEWPGGVTVTTIVGVQPDAQFAEAN